MNRITRVFYWVLSIALFIVGMILFYVDAVTLPGRYGADPMILLSPATWIVAVMPIAFSLTITLHLKDSEKYKSICRTFVAVG